MIGDGVELVDLQGSLLSEEVRFDERGLANMALLHKVFGDHQLLREHAVTVCPLRTIFCMALHTHTHTHTHRRRRARAHAHTHVHAVNAYICLHTRFT